MSSSQNEYKFIAKDVSLLQLVSGDANFTIKVKDDKPDSLMEMTEQRPDFIDFSNSVNSTLKSLESVWHALFTRQLDQ